MTEDLPIVECRGLVKHFPVRRGFLRKVIGWIKAVDGVDLVLEPGKTLGLVGESGCGKSTVGRLILKLIEPDRGRIFFRGEDISRYTRDEMKPLRRDLQIIFQDPMGSLNPRMTAGQAVEEGLRTLDLSTGRRTKRAAELLEMVGIAASAAERYPHEFSGGQRQRIGIARALSVGPSLIVCDEPVSALDVSVQAQIINLLEDLQESLSLSYLFISHDLNVVGYMSDTVAVMYLGQIMEIAPAETIFENALHPYTRALLSAVPSPDLETDKELKGLSGEVPSPFNPPPGCKFQGRCHLAEDKCRAESIPLTPVANDHRVRCWKVASQFHS